MKLEINELKPVPKSQYGQINERYSTLKDHERDTAKVLIKYGFNIEAIRPSNIPKNKNPDILLNGAIWEIKSPEGNGKQTILHNFRKASPQAGRLILDLCRTKLPESRALKDAISCFSNNKLKGIKYLMVVTKDKKVLEIKRK